MKIALIRQRYNPFGGAERFIDLALRALAAEGSTSVTLVTRVWETRESYIKCDPFYIGRTWRDWGFANAARAATRRGFDLVQSHERIAGCDVFRAGDGLHAQWLINRARASGALSNLAVRLSPWHRYTLAAERELFTSPKLRMVICNSRMVANEVSGHFGLDEKRIRVIYNGVDCKRFHPGLKATQGAELRKRLGIARESSVFIFVGSGYERKGLPQTLQAMTKLARDTHLLVLGADRKLESFKASAASLGLADRTHFAGPRHDIEGWYAAADCFVLPTLYDPFPNATLEAMASGLPVITSTQCGAAELIEPAQCGHACDALDTATLTRYMATITREKGATMGERARTVAEKLTLENMVNQFTSLYRELLSAR
ncbi:MAG TPA: glycosyltransferase family 4 protein [Burkholderiales bacterium]|nr:glycosyltransferase family 4 protein [Burkholderiales bacterium]